MIQNHLASVFLRAVAGSARSPFALLQHGDATTGNIAEYLIIVEPVGSGFLLALPAQPDPEAYHTVLAAGHCTLRWRGQTYALGKPKPVDTKTALGAFPLPLRLILRVRAIKHFRIMTAHITQH